MRIGILEDDASLADELVEVISRGGHRCFLHRSAESLMSFISHETIDVLLLDWNAEAASASEVIRRVRDDSSRHVPIVFLASPSAEQDIIAALRAGADGYAAKPLQPALLLARIETLYERWFPKPAVGRLERYGNYEFDAGSKTVVVGGASIKLTSKEFAVALMLFRNQERALSRSYIFEAVWGSNLRTQTRTVDSHVSKLRTKLDLQGRNGFRLVPVYGFGYRLDVMAEVDTALESSSLR